MEFLSYQESNNEGIPVVSCPWLTQRMPCITCQWPHRRQEVPLYWLSFLEHFLFFCPVLFYLHVKIQHRVLWYWHSVYLSPSTSTEWRFRWNNPLKQRQMDSKKYVIQKAPAFQHFQLYSVIQMCHSPEVKPDVLVSCLNLWTDICYRTFKWMNNLISAVIIHESAPSGQTGDLSMFEHHQKQH